MKSGKIILYSILFFCTAVLLFGYYYSISSPYMISAEKARSLLNQKKIDIIFDVRTKIERDVFGYFPGSIHIPAGSLNKETLSKFPNKDARILVYCNTGQRARMATETLKKLGYKNVMYIPTSHVALL